jgi:tRNA dimethylallyltransferase
VTDPEQPVLDFLVGPTAVGKTAFALELCARSGERIVSLDSMQVYRGMDIGTAKPTPAERARVPHSCLDLVEPSERYDVRRYLADAARACAEIDAAGRKALFVGGTGLYLKALARGLFGGPEADLELRARLEARALAHGTPTLHAELRRRDPPSAERIHPNDRKRVLRALEVLEQTGRPLSDWQREWGWHGAVPGGRPPRPVRPVRIVWLDLPPEVLDERIRARVQAMLAGGWVEEARSIRAGCGFGPTAIQALGYREVLALADGLRQRAQVEEELVRLTRGFVRRQRTWFRSFPGATRLDPRDPAALDRAARVLSGATSGS